MTAFCLVCITGALETGTFLLLLIFITVSSDTWCVLVLTFFMIKETSSTSTTWNVVPWATGLIVLGLCAAVSIWWAKRSRSMTKRGSHPLFPGEDSMSKEARHPIITTTIRDMIELSTSGSGSGEFFCLLFYIFPMTLRDLLVVCNNNRRIGQYVLLSQYPPSFSLSLLQIDYFIFLLGLYMLFD